MYKLFFVIIFIIFLNCKYMFGIKNYNFWYILYKKNNNGFIGRCCIKIE